MLATNSVEVTLTKPDASATLVSWDAWRDLKLGIVANSPSPMLGGVRSSHLAAHGESSAWG